MLIIFSETNYTFAQYSTLTFTGNSCSTDSSATDSGAVKLWDTTLHSVGRKKSAEQLGLGIYAGDTPLNFTPLETSHLETQEELAKSALHLTGNITFRLNNSTTKGGRIRAWFSNLAFTGSSIF